ncbi:hypothetical protein JMJ35_001103 [Cladonia borealis]|uniref:Uncharacterized protein n=1 Tax=Cladonia borealis TaxID=184061 RepID=A0AA39R9X4_9LECA|nr:hypothetical protein JMJ35_001103 [Cladonia borealis]
MSHADPAYSSSALNPQTLILAFLRLGPLIISSASLMCAWDQQNAFRSFLYPPLLKKPNHVSAHTVTEWFTPFAQPTKWVIILAYPIALALALFNTIGTAGAGLHPQTKGFYFAGGVLSVLHYWFGAWSMAWNAKISCKEDIGRKNEDALRGWLANNYARMLWVNLPAWVMFVCATATFIRV